MALTLADVKMWGDLAGAIPPSPRVLEIGQANWYGDVPAPDDCQHESSFVVARRWYQKALGYRSIVAVDLHGEDALPYDLNEPLPLEDVFDVVINTGTAEHVFDQRQLMQTINERCAVNGLMVHAAPWEGWQDHGFYCYQPCFFRDLAAANDYELLYFQPWKFGAPGGPVSSMLYVAMRKTRDLPFRVPRQGRYSNVRT